MTNETITALMSVLVFSTVYVSILAIANFFSKEQRLLQKRLQEMVKEGPHQKGLAKEVKHQNTLKNLFYKLSSLFAAKTYSVSVEKELVKGGIPLKGEEFIALRLLVACGSGFLSFILTGTILIGLIVGIVGFIIPSFAIRLAKTKRSARFNAQIGDCLVIMSNSLKAGFSFFQSMELVSREMPDPIAGEFSKVLREINLGTPTEEALLNLAERVGSDDLELVITAVLIQRQVGGNLSEVIDSISHTIRERVRIKGEIKALTAQGKISGIIIGLLPLILGMILFFINQEYIMSLFSSFLGISLVVGGLVSEIIGLIIIRKIVNIEV